MARSLPRSPGLCQGKGGAVASPHHHHLFFSQLPKGTEDLKRPSLSRLFHPPITEAIPLGHGESNRRCTLQVGTRDVDAAKNRSLARLLRVFPPAAIPGFNPAARSTTLLCLTWHKEGYRKSSVNLCLFVVVVLLACLHACNTFWKPICPSAAYHFHSTLPHL